MSERGNVSDYFFPLSPANGEMQELTQITRLRKSDFYDRIKELDERKQKSVIESQLPLARLSKYLSERLVTDKSTPVPDCITCGACCVFPLIVPVSMSDSERLSAVWEILLDDTEAEIPIDRVLPRENEQCMHLTGKSGDEVGCTIYNDRPTACRKFEAGSDRCHAYRRMYGFEQQLTETQVAAAMQKLVQLAPSGKINSVEITEDAAIFKTAFSSVAVEQFLESTRLKITVELDDESSHELNSYDASKEIWFESELLGCTLDEAREIKASRNLV